MIACVAGGAALGAALVLALGSRGIAGLPEPSPLPVAAARSEQAPARGSGCPGVVVAPESAVIAPRLEGTLQAIEVQLGQQVRKGDLLARLDTSALRQQLAMAEAAEASAAAELKKAQLQLRLATERLERTQRLTEHVSRAELEETALQRELAESEVQRASAAQGERRAHVAQLRVELLAGELRAPFDGRVSERYAGPGAQVGPKAPVLSLVGIRALVIRFAFEEHDAPAYGVGTRVKVRLEPAGPELEGTVASVAPEVDTASQLVIAEARLDDRAALEALSPGQRARVTPLSAVAHR